MYNPAYHRYREVQTQTAPATELTLLLYHGAIRFLNQAAAALDRRDLEAAHTGLLRAQAIIEELMVSLDLGAGPVSQSLQTLYAYMLQRLTAANCAKDRAPVDEVLGHLRELLSAWQEAFAARPQPSNGPAGGRGNYG